MSTSPARSAPPGGSGPTSSAGRSSAGRGTCCSTPPRAAARPRCWSSGSSAPCWRTASRSARSSRSRSPRRRRPSCASGSGRGWSSSAPADAARATEGAFISTIHGFCARVLRTHALAAGLDPRFEVLDADRARMLAGAAFERALEGLTDDAIDPVELIAAYGVGTLRAAVLTVHDQLRSLGQLAAAPARAAARRRPAAGTRPRSCAPPRRRSPPSSARSPTPA